MAEAKIRHIRQLSSPAASLYLELSAVTTRVWPEAISGLNRTRGTSPAVDSWPCDRRATPHSKAPLKVELEVSQGRLRPWALYQDQPSRTDLHPSNSWNRLRFSPNPSVCSTSVMWPNGLESA